MGIADRNYDSRLSFGTKMNPLVILIATCMIIFVALAFFKAITYLRFPENGNVNAYFDENILSIVALPPTLKLALAKGWTFFTYSFIHINVWQLIANMLWLWCFGYIFIDLTGNRKLIPLFIYATVIAALAYVITGNAMPAGSQTVLPYFYGSSACILAIAVAGTTIAPHYKLFPMLSGGISLWIITLIYAVINLATVPPKIPSLYFSQLAGGLTGFLFIYLLRKGFDSSGWMNRFYDWFIHLFDPETNATRQKIKATQFYKTPAIPFKKTANLTQQKLDEILDKMNQRGGYEILTAEEKDFLKRASEEDLKNK